MNAFPLWLQVVFYVGLALCMLPIVYRIVRGPHVLDRVMCLDAFTLLCVCAMGIWNISVGTTYFFDAVLAVTIVGFISTVALARYLESGDIVD